MNSFAGLNVAMKGLFASQQSIYTTDHNISNSETVGYSRQVTFQQASAALKTGDGTGMLGTGVDITSIQRVRDQFLDARYWKQNVEYGEWSVKSSALSELESIADETSEDGLASVMSDFYSSLEELSKDPGSEQTRTVVAEYAEVFCEYLQSRAADLNSLREDYNSNIKIKVEEVNSLAKQISDINELIYKSELDGSVANDLRDQRTVLIDELSALADVSVNEITSGTLPNGSADTRLQITLDGVSLVNHFDYNELECYSIDNGSDQDGMYGIRWAKTGMDVDIEGGELKGYLDLRDMDGENGEYKGVLYYINQLDDFARIFAKAFNEGVYEDGTQYCEGHAGGATSDGETGINFFSFNGLSTEEFLASGTDMDSRYSNITAANITISEDIENDPGKIAAASLSGESGNSDNINDLIDIFEDGRVFTEGKPEDFINSLTTTMGVVSQHASRLSESYSNILAQTDSKRTSVSGVQLDEETTNLVKYQQAYNAAAHAISVLDEILDVTINSLGAG